MNSYKKQTDKQIIVSLTSYPKRIHIVSKVLDSLYEQSMKADKILLWLAKEEFPNLDKDLPERLIDDKNKGKCEICWCDNIGSHKKYFYTMQEYPDDIVITVDDDIIYNRDTIKTLHDLHCKFPDNVACIYAKMILFDDKGQLLPYIKWLYNIVLPIPSMQIIPMGSGGVLYPPHVLDKGVFDKETILNTCKYNAVIYGDDVWLKTHSVLAGTSVVVQPEYLIYHEVIPEEQSSSISNLDPLDQQQHDRLFSAFLSRKSFDGKQTTKDVYLQTRNTDDYYDINSPIVRERTYQFVLEKLQIRIDDIYKNQKGEEVTIGKLHYFLSFFTKAMVNGNSDLDKKYINKLKEIFQSLPDIEKLSNKSILIKALLDYDAVLMVAFNNRFKQTDNYLKALDNWNNFLAISDKNIDYRYKQLYMRFLFNMEHFLKIYNHNIYSKEEIDNFKEAIKKSWKNLSFITKSRFMLNRIKQRVYRLTKDIFK